MIIIFIKDINLGKRSELIYVDMAKDRVVMLIIQVWEALSVYYCTSHLARHCGSVKDD